MKKSENKKASLATVGGGCFWCTEAVFNRIDGVISVMPGYAGGSTVNPTYEEVCSGRSGHAEVVQIEYDPEKISYEQLLEVFWKAHDPTTLNRQGADVGTQYRSIIFYRNKTEKDIAEESKKNIEISGAYKAPIVTEIKPFKAFYSAEEYHKEYYEKNRRAYYCAIVIGPKLKKLGLE